MIETLIICKYRHVYSHVTFFIYPVAFFLFLVEIYPVAKGTREQWCRSNFKCPILEPGKLAQPQRALHSFSGACSGRSRRATPPRSPPELPAGYLDPLPHWSEHQIGSSKIKHAIVEQLQERPSLEKSSRLGAKWDRRRAFARSRRRRSMIW